ncbi:BQ2448_5113 [Microbotryum intermedium]|uniref:BQ2448_5113 protein n=1 Tax=Microbotryum intermedium TaxID=269621 RepID=A0A238F054_9BASI|nr:BQ2448_5113 [Microbotryum intermedium]
MTSGVLSTQAIPTLSENAQDPTNTNAVTGPSKQQRGSAAVGGDLEPASDDAVDALTSTSTSPSSTSNTNLTRRLSRSRPRTSFHVRSSSSENQPPPPIRPSSSKSCLTDESPSTSTYRFSLAKISTTLEHPLPLDPSSSSSLYASGMFDVEPLIAHLDAIALERDRLGRHRLRTNSSEQRSTPPPSSPREVLDFADFVAETFRLQESTQGTKAASGSAPIEDHIDGGVDYFTPMQRGSFQLAEALTPVQSNTTYQFPRVETMSSLPMFPDMVPRTPRTSSLHATDLQRLIKSQSCDGRSVDLIDFESPSRKSLIVAMGSTPSSGSVVGTGTELSPLNSTHQLSDHDPNSAPPTPSSITGSSTNSIAFPGSASSRTVPLPPVRVESSDPTDAQVEASSDEGHSPPMADQSMHDEDDEEALEDDEEELTEDEEDEDPDSHPFYVLLASSAIPVLRSAWDAATLILVPPRRTLPSLEALKPRRETATPAFEFVRGGKGVAGEQAGRDVEKERQMLITYVALHAFKPLENDEDAAPGATSWRSVIASEEGHCRARLIPGQGVALIDWIEAPGPAPVIKLALSTASFASDISENASSGSRDGPIQPRSPRSTSAAVLSPARSSFSLIAPVRSLRIIAETTIYRRPRQVIAATNPPPAPSTLSASTNSTLGKSSGSSSLHKSGFRTPKWFRRSISSAIPTLKTWPEKTDPDSNPSSFVTPTLAPVRETTKSGPMLERVRVLALGGGIIMRRGSTSASSRSNRRTLNGTSISSDPEPVIRTSASSISLRLFRTESPLGSNSRSQSSLALSRHPTFELVGGETTSSQGHGPPSTRRRAGSMSSTRSARSGRSAFGIIATSANGMMRGEFLADLAFLASPPPQLAGLGPVFASTLEYIRALVREFEGGVAYIRGLEPYLIQRIRKGIFDRIWQQLVRDLDADEELRTWLVSEEHATNLRLLIENVIIGLLYRKLYTSSIVPHFAQVDATLNSIISTYQERRILPTDFGVHFDSAEPLANGALKQAIAILQDLKETSEVATKVPNEVAQLWVHSATATTTRRPGTASGRDDRSKSPSPSPASTSAPTMPESSSTVDEATATRPLRGVRTPLGCVTVIAESLQAMVHAIETLQGGSRLAPDDLIPLFSWVIVKAGVENLESLLFFVKTFRLSENLPSHLDWSFVNFQAALAFLLSDPLHCLPEPPASTPALSFGTKSSDTSTTTRLRRLSLQQYRPTHAGISPPSSPNSARGAGAGWYSPGATSVNREQSTSPTVSLPYPNYARERRLSWQQASKAPKRVSVTLDAGPMLPPKLERLTSSEEMPPPSWKLPASSRSRHHAETGGNVTPQSGTSEDGDTSAATRHLRALSLASLSSEGRTTDTRPRLVLPLEAMSRDRRVPSLSRSYSAVAMMTRPPGGAGSDMSFGLASTDMRRSESEGSPVVPDRFTYGDRWSFWGALPSSTATSNAPSSQRAVSPPTGESAYGEGPPSSYDPQNSSWWGWGGGLSASALSPTSQLAASLYPIANDASTQLRRLRSFSASAAEIIAERPSHLDQVVTESSSSSSIRLAAILQNKTSETDMLPPARPRPRSTMSVSSIGSNASFVLSSESEEMSSVPAAVLVSTGLTPNIVVPPPPRRRPTRSRTWRELPTSNLAGAPLAPRLDSTSIVSIPRTSFVASIEAGSEANLTAPGSSAAQSPEEPRSSFDTSRSASFELTRSPDQFQPTSPSAHDPHTTSPSLDTFAVPLMT